MQSSFAFSDLCRRVANLIRIGKVAEVDGAQVKVVIGKVKTNWLPILSTAGDTNCWIPISVGEQVVVFSPYGEMTQAVVVRSIHYNEFAAPENKNDVSINSKVDVKANGEGKLEVSFKNGVELKVGDAFVKIVDDQITIASGGASIALSSSGIQLSCGASSINISESNISLASIALSTSPPICKCAGGV